LADVDSGADPGKPFIIATLPASAGALIYDRSGRLLILNPTYKSGWTIPGGVMEADGESPWQACQREVREECGLEVTSGRLACMDFRRPKPGNPGGMTLQAQEVSEYRLAPWPDALRLLRKPIRRRVRAARRSGAPRYLENGRPVPGVGR
jgi:8-oxo-dGTP diphosphatase